MSYKIVRIYFNGGSSGFRKRRTIATGLTLEQAQAHCQDPETSSSKCTRADRKRITERNGPWFDGYEEE